MYAAVLAAVSSAALALLRRRWLKALVLALLFFSLGLLRFQLNYENTAARVYRAEGELGSGYGRLCAWPAVYDDYCRLEVQLSGSGLDGLKAIVYDNESVSAGYLPGDTIAFSGRLSPADKIYGAEYDRYFSRGIYMKLNALEIEYAGPGSRWDCIPQRLSRELSQRIAAIFPADVSAFMQALMLGDKSRLYKEPGLELAMSRAGLMHVVAVSGMHVAFMVGLLRLLLGYGRKSSLLCMALVWGFVLLVGAPPSAVRAGFMQSLLLLAPVLRRENDPVTSLFLALALILLQNPYAAASVSLQLSFAAVAGIFCFSGRLYRRMSRRIGGGRRRAPLRYLAANVSTSLGALVFTLPLTAVHFGYVSLLSPLSNVLGLWAVSLCFCMGWLSCLLSLFSPLGPAAAWLCAWLARYIFHAAEFVSSMPFAVVYTETAGLTIWLLLSYLGAAAALAIRKRFKAAPALALLLSLLSLGMIENYVNLSYRRGQGVLTQVNVGHGLCTVAMRADSTAVINCGSVNSLDNAGELAGRYLLSRGRSRVDILLLSNLSEEYANGAAMLMEMVELKRLVLPAAAEEGPVLDGILSAARSHGVEVAYINRSSSLEAGGIRIQAFTASNDGERNNALALRLGLGDCEAFIPGDISMAEERRISREQALENTEILVVGRHGSASAGSELMLWELNGSIALISAGYNNFGCPEEETLERLSSCGYNIYRTDKDGTVEIRIS